MKYICALVVLLSSISGVQCQTQLISKSNAEYTAWADANASKVMTDVKEGQPHVDGTLILDQNGVSLADNFLAGNFRLSDYDLNTIAPDKNTLIKIDSDTYLFVKSRYRQEILYKRAKGIE